MLRVFFLLSFSSMLIEMLNKPWLQQQTTQQVSRLITKKCKNWILSHILTGKLLWNDLCHNFLHCLCLTVGWAVVALPCYCCSYWMVLVVVDGSGRVAIGDDPKWNLWGHRLTSEILNIIECWIEIHCIIECWIWIHHIMWCWREIFKLSYRCTYSWRNIEDTKMNQHL